MYEEAAQLFWDLKDHDGYRGAQNGLGVLKLKAGSLSTAEEAFERALASAVEDGHTVDQARAKMNLGLAYQSRGTRQGYEAAETAYREALPLARNWNEPDVLFNLAQLLYFYVGRYRDARAEAVSAAEAYGRAGSAKESWVRDLISEIDNATG